MFNNIKISYRMISGTIFMLLLILAVGYFGFKANNRIEAQSRVITASRSMILNIVEVRELLNRYLSTDNLDQMGAIEKEILGKNDIVNAWIKILSNEQPNPTEAKAIGNDLINFGVNIQDDLLASPEIASVAKSIEILKNTSNEIYQELIQNHEDKIALKGEFDSLYQKEKDKRYFIKSIIDQSNNIALARIFGEVPYLSKEALYQYKDQDHISQWLLSINTLKTEAISEENGILNTAIDDYYSIANNLSNIVLLIVEKENFEVLKKVEYDNSIIALNSAKSKMNDAILSLSAKTINNTNILLFGIIFVAVIMGILVSIIITRSVTEPIKKLVISAKKISEGNLSHRVDIKGNDEMSQFASIFNNMAVKLERANKEIVLQVERQKRELIAGQLSLSNQQKALLNVLEDVDLERRENAEERDRVSTILEGIADGVMVVNKDKEIILFNNKAEELSGFSVDEVINKKYDEAINFVHEDNLKLKDDFIDISVAKGENFESVTQTSLIKKDTKITPIDKSASIIKNENGEVIACVIVFRDITKEREIDKAKTEFVSLASHQLRTPLSSINWYTEMLLAGDAGKINKDQKEYLTEVYAGSKRMVDLVNSLLNVSRIELGTFAIDPGPLKLKDICDSLLKELSQDIIKKQIKIVKKISKLTPIIIADAKLISIIFQNLLSNSVKYTLPGGSITINIKKDGENVAIEIADSGMGIPLSQQGQIFSKMFRADNVRAADTEGTGLGLYIVKAIVQNSGGTISFKSKEGKGTTFYIKLPIKGVEKREGTKELSAS